MRPPSIPDDRPTTPLPSLAVAQPAQDDSRRAGAASTLLYLPAAVEGTIYRPEPSYSVTARPVQPLAPPRACRTNSALAVGHRRDSRASGRHRLNPEPHREHPTHHDDR